MTRLKNLLSRRQFVKLWSGATALAIGKRPGAALGGTTDADVIVVGAGSFGCNTAWHLRERGVKVLVLESADMPASQASRAGAGFIAYWSGIVIEQWSKPEWQIEQYGIKFYTQLAAGVRRDIGFSHCGIAYVFITAEGWGIAGPRIAGARKLGTRIEILQGPRAAMLLPEINFKSTTGIAFDPDAVRVRAGDAIRTMADQLAHEGVRFKYDTAVKGFVREGGRVVGVKSDAGDFRAASVIVTAGAWSRPLLERAGAQCPADPLAATRYTTKPLSGIGPKMPLLIWPDFYDFYIREERRGLLIGADKDDPPMPKDRLPDRANPPRAERIPPDQAYREREYIRKIEHVMPTLKHAEIDQITSGIATFTSDKRFIADAVPQAPGLYVLTACHEAGITHGPGLGRMMAELVTTGRTTWDRDSFRLDRFQVRKNA
jgi:glycine/D-amino acid oxidase-like deaminating enzyme